MPKVSEFFGIQIVFNYRGEHNPPHFHARHSGREGVFAISPLAYLHGDLPPRRLLWCLNGHPNTALNSNPAGNLRGICNLSLKSHHSNNSL
jgi:hypothetical protein